MPSAWQKREYETQKLVEDLTKTMFDVHEQVEDGLMEESETFILEIAQAALESIGERHPRARPMKPTFLEHNPEAFTVAREFWNQARERIQGFARSDVEADHITAAFFENEIVPRVTAVFNGAFVKERAMKPEVIYLAPTGNTEVPLVE